MPVTQKQLIANRENSRSGGVKTEAGKAVSRLNATTHGIFTSVVVASMEDSGILNELRARVFDELEPHGIIEETLVDRIVVCMWRLRRCAIADKSVMEQQFLSAHNSVVSYTEEVGKLNSSIWVITRGQTELLLRYETTIERQLYRVMAELRALQRIRQDSRQLVEIQSERQDVPQEMVLTNIL
jgi:hypothetical protein